MTTTAAHSGQVTVTVTSAPDGTDAAAAAADTASSTLSLIYIYSTSTSSQPTGASSASSGSTSGHVSGGAIAGIVIGCIAFLVLMSLALFCYSRKVARKRRAEMASLHASQSPTAPSMAYSRATTVQVTRDGRRPKLGSQYAQSEGAQSAGTGMGTLPKSLKSTTPSPRLRPSPSPRLNSSPSPSQVPMPMPMLMPMPSIPPSPPPPAPLPAPPPPAAAELPTPHNSKDVRVVNVRKPKPEVAEMYGSYTHPVELHAGSTTDLVSVKSEMARMRASGGGGRRASVRDRADSDVGSRGFLSSAEPEWHSPSARPDSGDGPETEYGTADGASIHIYYRSSAATIAQAMSQASFTKGTSTKASRSTMGSSTTPLFSQTSLADTTR